MNEYKNVDEYISGFPEKTQIILEKVRKTIRFQLDEPIPYALIEKITRACAEKRK